MREVLREQVCKLKEEMNLNSLRIVNPLEVYPPEQSAVDLAREKQEERKTRLEQTLYHYNSLLGQHMSPKVAIFDPVSYSVSLRDMETPSRLNNAQLFDLQSIYSQSSEDTLQTLVNGSPGYSPQFFDEQLTKFPADATSVEDSIRLASLALEVEIYESAVTHGLDPHPFFDYHLHLENAPVNAPCHVYPPSQDVSFQALMDDALDQVQHWTVSPTLCGE